MRELHGIDDEQAEDNADDGKQSQEKICPLLVPVEYLFERGGVERENGDAAEEKDDADGDDYPLAMALGGADKEQHGHCDPYGGDEVDAVAAGDEFEQAAQQVDTQDEDAGLHDDQDADKFY